MKPFVLILMAVVLMGALIAFGGLQVAPTSDSVKVYERAAIVSTTVTLPVTAVDITPASAGVLTGISVHLKGSGNPHVAFFLRCNGRLVGSGGAYIAPGTGMWVTVPRTSAWNASFAAGEDCALEVQGGNLAWSCGNLGCYSEAFPVVMWGRLSTWGGSPSPPPSPGSPPSPVDGNAATDADTPQPPPDEPGAIPYLGIGLIAVAAIALVLIARR